MTTKFDRMSRNVRTPQMVNLSKKLTAQQKALLAEFNEETWFYSRDLERQQRSTAFTLCEYKLLAYSPYSVVRDEPAYFAITEEGRAFANWLKPRKGEPNTNGLTWHQKDYLAKLYTNVVIYTRYTNTAIFRRAQTLQARGLVVMSVAAHGLGFNASLTPDGYEYMKQLAAKAKNIKNAQFMIASYEQIVAASKPDERPIVATTKVEYGHKFHLGDHVRYTDNRHRVRHGTVTGFNEFTYQPLVVVRTDGDNKRHVLQARNVYHDALITVTPSDTEWGSTPADR